MRRKKLNRRGAVLIIASLFICLLVSGANTAFIDIGMGARPIGLGGAFTGLANDANAVTYNPAGLGQMPEEDKIINTVYVKPFLGLSDYSKEMGKTIIGYYPVNINSYLLTYINPISTFYYREYLHGTLGFSLKGLYAPLQYMENEFIFSYGRKMNNDIQWFYDLVTGQKVRVKAVMDQPLYLGINFKAMTNSYILDSNNPYLKDNEIIGARSKIGFAGDIGVMYEPVSRFLLSINAVNFASTPVGVQGESLPFAVRIGTSYSIMEMAVFDITFLHMEDIAFVADYQFRRSMSSNFLDGRHSVFFGAETWLLDKRFGMRTGFNVTAYPDMKFKEASAGLSYRAGEQKDNYKLQFDYAFTYPFTVVNTYGSHRASLSFSFKSLIPAFAETKVDRTADPKKEEDNQKLKEQELQKIKEVELEKKTQDLKDIKKSREKEFEKNMSGSLEKGQTILKEALGVKDKKEREIKLKSAIKELNKVVEIENPKKKDAELLIKKAQEELNKLK